MKLTEGYMSHFDYSVNSTNQKPSIRILTYLMSIITEE